MKFHINKFVRRQTPESPFTHFDGDDAELLSLLKNAAELSENIENGYRDGVILVKVNPSKFKTGVEVLKDGDMLIGKFRSRSEGETPRKTIYLDSDEGKQPATLVKVVCYHSSVLAEDGDNEKSDAYEIIALNGFPTDEETPIHPDTLMHNHFKSDGGTATNMSPEEFERQMKESFEYWRGKVMVKPQSWSSD